jgi:hypothetical protein
MSLLPTENSRLLSDNFSPFPEARKTSSELGLENRETLIGDRTFATLYLNLDLYLTEVKSDKKKCSGRIYSKVRMICKCNFTHQMSRDHTGEFKPN